MEEWKKWFLDMKMDRFLSYHDAVHVLKFFFVVITIKSSHNWLPRNITFFVEGKGGEKLNIPTSPPNGSQMEVEGIEHEFWYIEA